MEFKRHKHNSKNCRLKSKYSLFLKMLFELLLPKLRLGSVVGDDRQRRQGGAGAHDGGAGKPGKQPLPQPALVKTEANSRGRQPTSTPVARTSGCSNTLSSEGVPEKENLKSQTGNCIASGMMRRFGRDGPGCAGQMFSTRL